MILKPLVPRFECVEASRGRGWLVRASWSSGRTAEVPGFDSKDAADAWIRDESPAWLAARLTRSHD